MRVVLIVGVLLFSCICFAEEVPNTFQNLENSAKLNADICDRSLLPKVTAKNFWKYPKRAYQYVKNTTGQTISKLKYKKRLSYYKFLAKHRGESERLNIILADVLNSGLEKRWIKLEDFRKIVEDINKEGLYKFFTRADGKVDLFVASEATKFAHWDDIIKKSGLSLQDQMKWKAIYSDLHLTGPELKRITGLDLKLPKATEDNIMRFKSYLIYSNGKTAVGRMKSLEELPILFSKDADDLVKLKRFERVNKKISKFKNRQEKKLIKKHVRKTGNKPSAEELSKIRNQVKDKGNLFERLYHGCRSKRKSHRPDTGKAGSYFNKFSAGASTVIAGGAYWYIHSIENQEEWTMTHTKELTFDLVSNFISGYLVGALTGGSTDGFVGMSVKNYMAQSGFNHGAGIIWKEMFGENKGMLIDAIDKIKDSPDFEAELTKLYEELDQHEELQSYISEIRQLMEEQGHGPEVFETEEGQDLMLQVIAEKMYHHDSQAWIKTGDLGTDYTVFHLAYFAGRIPLVVWTGLQAYNLICTGPSNWTNYLKAGGILLADRVAGNAIYYWLRDKAIFSPAAIKEQQENE